MGAKRVFVRSEAEMRGRAERSDRIELVAFFDMHHHPPVALAIDFEFDLVFLFRSKQRRAGRMQDRYVGRIGIVLAFRDSKGTNARLTICLNLHTIADLDRCVGLFDRRFHRGRMCVRIRNGEPIGEAGGESRLSGLG